jgi:hypothetical protein
MISNTINIELLDYFAGQSLQALVSSRYITELFVNKGVVDYPKLAYKMANEMLKERENYFPTKIDVTTAKQIQ